MGKIQFGISCGFFWVFIGVKVQCTFTLNCGCFTHYRAACSYTDIRQILVYSTDRPAFTSNHGCFCALSLVEYSQLRCSYSYICLYILCLCRLGWHASRRIFAIRTIVLLAHIRTFVYILHANHQSQLRCFPWWNTHNSVVRIRTFVKKGAVKKVP